MDAIDLVIQKLHRVKKTPNGFSTECPAHDDRTNSLSVAVGDDGRILLHCHAGCSISAIVAALGLKMGDLFPPKPFPNHKSRIVATYDYRDVLGELLYQVVRYDPKDFRQRRPKGKRWLWNLNGTRRVLYRLSELTNADPSKVVYVCEGEKDVENLRGLQLVATTNVGGAGKWRANYSEFLRGRDVVILPDNDSPGRDHAERIATSLQGIAASVRVLPLPGLAPHGDVSDWVKAGGSVAELEQLVAATRIYATPAETDHANTMEAQTRELIKLPLTDAGNAEAFVLLNGERVRYDHLRKRWLILSCASRWREDPDGEMDRLALATVRARRVDAAHIDNPADSKKAYAWALASESQNRRRALLETAANFIPIADAGLSWDEKDWDLGCENGPIGLCQGALREGTPGDRITMTTGLNYSPNAKAERWLQFLEEVFNEPALIDFVHRAVGYSLTGDMSEQCIFLCHGVGANGKSVFLAVLRTILGDYAANTPFSSFEVLDGNQGTNDLAALVGKRLVTASETREGCRLNEARVKAMSGGDPITARFLFREFFTFRPRAKIWLAVNHKPNVRDDSFGFWRRIRLIPFLHKFEGRAADKRLLDTLRAEAEGILAWAVQGCLEWQRRGLEPPECIASATNDWREEADPLVDLLSNCTLDKKASATAADLYKFYSNLAEANGEHPMKRNAFGRRLTERGFLKERETTGAKRILYRGIGLPDQKA